MDAASIDASVHRIARERSVTVTIVADGSHHGANAYCREGQHDSAAENKQRSPLEIRDSQHTQDETALEPTVVRRSTLLILKQMLSMPMYLNGSPRFCLTPNTLSHFAIEPIDHRCAADTVRAH